MDGCQKVHGIAKRKDCCSLPPPTPTSVSVLKHIKNKPPPKVFISGVEVCSGFTVASVLNITGSVLCKDNLFIMSLKRVCMLGGAEKEKIADPAVPLSAGNCMICGLYCGMLEHTLGITRPDPDPSFTS